GADVSTFFCCSGTLGALVLLDGAPHILSTNRVLARSGSAVRGEGILQPGLMDNGCSANGLNLVGGYAGNLVPLGQSVDTALARVRPGQVDSSGAILGLGVPCASPAVARIGMRVEKSGRTTGVTAGVVQAINLTTNIQYQSTCHGGRRFRESYSHQIAITPGSFSGSGDSGSLILSAGLRPVALLYAGSSVETLANPIQDVIAAYQAGGHSFAFVGRSCKRKSAEESSPGIPSDLAVEEVTAVKDRHQAELFSHPGVLGIGVGKVDDQETTTETAIVVYFDSTPGAATAKTLPATLEGIKLRVIPTEPFVAR
nr:S1 family peptidase [Acidobacteriota bacterium]